MTIHYGPDDFTPRRRPRRPTLSELEARYRATIEAARLRGRALTAQWFRDNPLRRYRVRPAVQSEFVSATLPSFPDALVCSFAQNLEPPIFVQLVVSASRETVEACRRERDEDFAAALFEFARKAETLQRDEIFAVHPGGEIELLGVAAP